MSDQQTTPDTPDEDQPDVRPDVPDDRPTQDEPEPSTPDTPPAPTPTDANG